MWKIRVKETITINHGEEVTLPGGLSGEYGEWVSMKPRWMCSGVVDDANSMVDNGIEFQLMDFSETVWSSTHPDIKTVIADCYKQLLFFKVGLL